MSSGSAVSCWSPGENLGEWNFFHPRNREFQSTYTLDTNSPESCLVTKDPVDSAYKFGSVLTSKHRLSNKTAFTDLVVQMECSCLVNIAKINEFKCGCNEYSLCFHAAIYLYIYFIYLQIYLLQLEIKMPLQCLPTVSTWLFLCSPSLGMSKNCKTFYCSSSVVGWCRRNHRLINHGLLFHFFNPFSLCLSLPSNPQRSSQELWPCLFSSIFTK